MNNKLATIKLIDGSSILIWYQAQHAYPGSTYIKWTLIDLYHEAPLSRDHNGVEVASHLTNLHAMIPAIMTTVAPFFDLWFAIDRVIRGIHE